MEWLLNMPQDLIVLLLLVLALYCGRLIGLEEAEINQLRKDLDHAKAYIEAMHSED